MFREFSTHKDILRSEFTNATAVADADYRYGYAFGDIGNRLTATERGTNTAYSANTLNQYAAVGRGVPAAPINEDTFVPQYDADGNQTLVKTATGIWSVEYNGENRPIRWTSGDTEIAMDYDSMGRRAYYCETNNDEQVAFMRFFYDGYKLIQQLDESGNVTKEFVWDPTEPIATKPLCFRLTDQPAAFYLHDGNKNVTDEIQVLPSDDSVAHYDYAPFGEICSLNGSYSTTNPFRFSSEFFDHATALIYYNFRHYDSILGRWLNRDLVGEHGGINLYIFSGIVQITDVLGLAGRVTHGQTRCREDDDCCTLASKTTAWIRNYLERKKELQQDKYNLKQTNPIRYNNHIDEIEKSQNNILNCIRISSGKCGNNDFIPQFSPEPLPAKIPIPDKTPEITPNFKWKLPPMPKNIMVPYPMVLPFHFVPMLIPL